nr:hypothetical protein [uncultured Roseateles sp.]
MGLKRCLACAAPFKPCPQVPAQNYCARPECQKERRKLWQRQKRKADDDYRENQSRCQKRWNDNHRDYWERYRAAHPEYVAANREKQHSRNATRCAVPIAKMDASLPESPLRSGTYRLSTADDAEIAKMDAWIVKITVLSGT